MDPDTGGPTDLPESDGPDPDSHEAGPAQPNDTVLEPHAEHQNPDAVPSGEEAPPSDSQGPDAELSDDIGPLLDPRRAATGHVTAATVLAGFCLTAIVLISNSPNADYGAFDRAVGALLTAFLCLVLSGFLESLVQAQTKRSRRTFLVALLSAVAIATSAMFALWGLCEIIDVHFEGAGISKLTGWVFVWGSIGIAALVTHVGINVRRVMGEDRVSRWGVIGGHVGWLLVALVLCAVEGIDDQSDLDVIVALQLGGMTTGLIGALVVMARANTGRRCFEFNMGFTYFLVGVPTAVATALLLRLPSNPLW